MKKIESTYRIIIILLLISFSELGCGSREKPSIDIKININKIVNHIKELKSTKNYELEAVLSNNGNKEVGFWILSCSWYDNLVVDCNSLKLSPLGCDSNTPKLIILQPKETIEFKVPVTLTDSSNQLSNCKGAFILINKENFNNLQDLRAILNKSRVNSESLIWSSPIILK